MQERKRLCEKRKQLTFQMAINPGVLEFFSNICRGLTLYIEGQDPNHDTCADIHMQTVIICIGELLLLRDGDAFLSLGKRNLDDAFKKHHDIEEWKMFGKDEAENLKERLEKYIADHSAGSSSADG